MSRLVFQEANVFDANSGNYLANQTIAIKAGKFDWVGPDSDYQTEDGDIVRQLEGKFVFPGLIDCHVHLEATTTVDWAKEMMRSKDGKYHYIALHHAQLHLRAGFTTLRDVGGGDWGAPLRRIFAEGLFSGPRLLVAQRTIGQFGNQEKMGPREWIEATQRYDVEAGPYGIVQAVRDRKASGSDLIKTMTTGGVLHGMESQLDRSLWTEEELDAMVTEAHRLGMRVAVHAHGLHGIIKAANAGVDTIEHCSFVNEKAATVMKEKKIILVPTQTSAFMDKPDLMEQLEPEVREKTIAVDSAMFRNHKLAYELGVKIACGTDAGVPGNPHGTSAREISSYVEHLNMSPAQAIQTATINAAEAIGMGDSLGVIEPGRFADLIITKEDPLEDITVLENIKNILIVVKEGKIVAEKGKLSN
jgi:imidazolonepropionase-like amidohydrolase